MVNIKTPLNNIGINLNWNGRKDIGSSLMELAVDLAANGQEKPAEVVRMDVVRAFALDHPWVEGLIKGFSSEVEYLLLSGHRRYSATELAVERGLVPKERGEEFLVEDVTPRIKKPSDLRRINIRENAQQRPKTAAENANDVLRMKEVELIPVEEIAEFYGKRDEKGIRWVKDAARVAKELHPAVYAALDAGTIQWSTALEYAKMPQEEQARAIHKGLIKVAEVKAERSESAGRSPRVQGGGVSYKSTKDQLAGIDALLKANERVKETSAECKLLAAFAERLRGGTSLKQFIARLGAIHDNGNLETGAMVLKAEETDTVSAAE